MLKPMKPKPAFPRNIFLWILVAVLVLSGIIALVSAFSGGDSGEEEVNAVYTNAAATVAAQQMTLLASAPSATPTLSVTQTSTATVTPLASPTLFTSQPIASNTASAPSGAVGCNNSAYVADVTIPDNTAVTPGQAITKTWKLQNTGTCPWMPTYKISFLSGNAMGGVATPIGVTVQPGQSADISIALTAPATTGDALGTWILTNDSNQNFGSWFTILVKVGAAGPTGTPTATATATTVAAVAPAAASSVAITLTCTLGGTGGTQKEHAGNLTWVDNSTNETGFNIYINSVFAATVAPNTTLFVVPPGTFFDPGVSSTFAVEAVNGTLKAAQVPISANCP